MMEHIRESKWLNILMSVLLAVLFWLYVRAELDPAQTSWFYHVPVEITGTASSPARASPWPICPRAPWTCASRGR